VRISLLLAGAGACLLALAASVPAAAASPEDVTAEGTLAAADHGSGAVTYNPAVVRVRTVQEGSFMRSGGVQAAFTSSQSDGGRVDIAVVRPNDATGVAGTGLLSALLFDTVGPGPANLSVTGTGSAPGGGSLALQFAPTPTVTVK